MAVISTFLVPQTAGTGLVASQKHGILYVETTVNMASCASPPDSGDTLTLFEVPIGAEILSLSCNVTTACSEACTFDVGFTGGDVDAFLDGIDFEVTGKSFGVQSSPAGFAAGSVPATTERTISMLLNAGTNIAAGVVKFRLALRDAFC